MPSKLWLFRRRRAPRFVCREWPSPWTAVIHHRFVAQRPFDRWWSLKLHMLIEINSKERSTAQCSDESEHSKVKVTSPFPLYLTQRRLAAALSEAVQQLAVEPLLHAPVFVVDNAPPACRDRVPLPQKFGASPRESHQ